MSTIVQKFDKIGVWERAGQRAPHKPLLLLLALGRWAGGDRSDIPFRDANAELAPLLKEFGPPRRQVHPEYPFWWLQSDKIWVVRSDRDMAPRTGSKNPPKRELLSANARGGLTEDVKSALAADPALVSQLMLKLLDAHFPSSLHADILAAVGLDSLQLSGRAPRDRSFRQRVLTAYEYKCAVCGFDLRLGSLSIALDAAHIRWHQAGGPDTEMNGLALCVLHHKVFDLGAFTVKEGVFILSDQANGTGGFTETLLAHHGKPIRNPQNPGWRPDSAHFAWHRRQVFKGVARHHG